MENDSASNFRRFFFRGLGLVGGIAGGLLGIFLLVLLLGNILASPEARRFHKCINEDIEAFNEDPSRCGDPYKIKPWIWSK